MYKSEFSHPLLADHVFIQIYRHNYRYMGICLRFKKALFIFSLKPWVLWAIHSRKSCCGNILFYAKFSLESCWYHSMPKKILKCSLTKTSRVIKCYVKKKKVSCLKGKYFERTSTWRENLTQMNKRKGKCVLSKQELSETLLDYISHLPSAISVHTTTFKMPS